MSYFKDSIGIAIIFGLLLAFFNESVWAQEPDELIFNAVFRMHQAALDPRGRTDLATVADEVILPLLAVESISKQVLGKNWRKMSPAQRAKFLELFPKLIVQIHTKALDRIGEARIFFPQQRPPRDGKATVKMEVRFPDQTHHLDYVMRNIDGEWKVVDMSINGLSMVVTYRPKIVTALNYVPRALLINDCRIPREPRCVQAKMEYFLDGLDRKVNPREHPDN